jgi:hypothetical protein
LSDQAQELGLAVSERSAYRVARKEIAPLSDLYRLAARRATGAGSEAATALDLQADRRGLKIDRSDLETFQHEVEAAFDVLAEKYYLCPQDAPKLRLNKNALTVTFPFEKES